MIKKLTEYITAMRIELERKKLTSVVSHPLISYTINLIIGFK